MTSRFRDTNTKAKTKKKSPYKRSKTEKKTVHEHCTRKEGPIYPW